MYVHVHEKRNKTSDTWNTCIQLYMYVCVCVPLLHTDLIY